MTCSLDNSHNCIACICKHLYINLSILLFPTGTFNNTCTYYSNIILFRERPLVAYLVLVLSLEGAGAIALLLLTTRFGLEGGQV